MLRRFRLALCFTSLLTAVLWSTELLAIPVDEVPEDVAWRVESIEVEGEQVSSEGEIEKVILTKERAWYAPWREKPPFDRVTFVGDLDRIRRLYESRGYYGADVDADLVPNREDETLEIVIDVVEGEPVRV